MPLPQGRSRPHGAGRNAPDRAGARPQAQPARPTLRAKAVALAREKGLVRTRDLTAIGVPRFYLRLMCQEGLLERVGYGLYRPVFSEAA